MSHKLRPLALRSLGLVMSTTAALGLTLHSPPAGAVPVIYGAPPVLIYGTSSAAMPWLDGPMEPGTFVYTTMVCGPPGGGVVANAPVMHFVVRESPPGGGTVYTFYYLIGQVYGPYPIKTARIAWPHDRIADADFRLDWGGAKKPKFASFSSMLTEVRFDFADAVRDLQNSAWMFVRAPGAPGYALEAELMKFDSTTPGIDCHTEAPLARPR